jgi:uracil-DNA glycosylase family 4
MAIKECTLCKRCEGRSQIVSPREATSGIKYLVVLDNPAKEDDYTGTFGSGQMGDLLRSLFKSAGIDFSEVHLTAATRCYTGKAPLVKEIEACHPYLVEELGSIGVPDIVITMGSASLQTILGKTKGVNALRGSMHTTAFDMGNESTLELKVMPTYAPGIVFRDPTKYDLIVHDIRKARMMLEGVEEPEGTDVFVAQSLEDAMEIRDILLASAEFSFDIETTGLNPRNEDTPQRVGARVLCLSFSNQVGKGYVIPLFGQYCTELWNQDEFEQLLEIVAEILESDIPKIASNGKFDVLYIATVLKIYVRNFAFDAQLGHGQLHEEPPHNLEHMRTVYTTMSRYEGFKDDPKYTKDEINYWGYAVYDNWDLWLYAGADADCELRVSLRIRPLILKESMTGGGVFAKKLKA